MELNLLLNASKPFETFIDVSVRKSRGSWCPLNDLRGLYKSNVPILWTESAKKAFTEVILQWLADTTLLTHPKTASVNITVDASDYSNGAILQQQVLANALPFIQRPFLPFNAQRVVAHQILPSFRQRAECRFMDHKPLILAVTCQKPKKCSLRQFWYLKYIS